MQQLERVEWLQTLRDWALGLGVVAIAAFIGMVGFVGVGNPKNWSSLYAAFAGEGLLRWAAVPLVVTGALLLVAALALHLLAVRSKR